MSFADSHASSPEERLESADLLRRDHRSLTAYLERINGRARQGKPVDRSLTKWVASFEQASRRAETFHTAVPALEYPPELPVSQHREAILEAIRNHPVVIVRGDTGSGKTTQLPKLVFEAGCGHAGRIGVTQPRRLAATSMARRVAEECRVDYGDTVGAQVRFEDRTSERTRIQFMTDGLLLAQLPNDPDWLAYDALIIDEAHERSLNIDFILGCLRGLLTRRKDLKVVISSATLDAERFSAFFGNAPVITVEGRLYPIEDEYLPELRERDLELSDQVLEAVRRLDGRHGPRDTLVFLPGEREIRETARKLEPHFGGRADVLPLFARLGMQDQQKVFGAGTRRRIILATNVAETSVTLPGIRAVVDTGWVRLQRFHPQSQIQRLVTEQVSQASAKQRRGRCGRIGPGVCLRLYAEEDLETAPAYTDPEIRRCSLAEVILRMAVLGLPPLQEFPLIDPPKGAQVAEGYRTLFEIGAMTKTRELTPRGRLLATFNLEPRLARMLEEGEAERVLPAVLVCAAMLSLQDPRERPAEKTEAADRAHRAWKHPESDFLGVLNLWNAVCGAGGGQGKRNRFCWENFLNPNRVREWINLVDDLRETCKEHGWDAPGSIGELELLDTDGLHRSILAGAPRSVGERDENRQFRTPSGQTFLVFPGSALGKKPPKWVMAFTLLQTSRLFARECAALNPEWVEQVAPHLCRYHYERPQWNPERGFVEAEERVMLGQLTLRFGTKVHYGRIEPAEARGIFLRDALVPGALDIRDPSMDRYRERLASLDRWERKLRRPGYFLGSDALMSHLEQVVPPDIHTAKDFARWCRTHDWVPGIRELTGDAKLNEDGYPDRIEVRGVPVGIDYAYAPEDPERDGVCFVVERDRLAELPEELLEWTIPAWLPEKIEALIKSLDKKLRIACNPVNATADDALAWMRDNGFVHTHSLHHALAAFLAARLDRILAAPDLNPDRIPPHLRARLSVVDEKGREVYTGQRFPGRNGLPGQPAAPKAKAGTWQRGGHTDWPEEEIPETVEIGGRTHWTALVDEGASVGVGVFPSEAEAEASRRAAVVRLFGLVHPDPLRFLQKRLPLPTSVQLDLSTLPSDGGDALADIIDGILREALGLHHAVPRDRRAFHAAADAARGVLFEVAEKRGRELQEIFGLRSEVRVAVETKAPPHAGHDLELQQTLLWAPGWCRDPENLQRYPRYLKAIQVRLERAARDPAKDEKKQREMQPALDLLSESSGHLPPERLREAFRKIEELRLSVFAPELRPFEKISVVRFERWLDA